MTTERQAASSIASLVRIIAKHLNISQSALIDAVAHRLFAADRPSDVPQVGADGWRRPRTCIKHNLVYADGERCGLCADLSAVVFDDCDDGLVNRQDLMATPPAPIPVAGTCRRCGCTDADCSDCIRLTGVTCTWIEPDLCSACVELMKEV